MNLKTITDDILTLGKLHKQIGSVGVGDFKQLNYMLKIVDKQDNTTNKPAVYPILYVNPQTVTNDTGMKTFTFNCVVIDIINQSMSNETDVMSDCDQIADDIISAFLFPNVTPQINITYDINTTVTKTFISEKYDDFVSGVLFTIQVEVPVDINRCFAAFETTPIPPTTTTSTTEAPTTTTTTTICPEITQYLEVELEENTKFKLKLWEDQQFTQPASAECDYVVSGIAYGSLGTVYAGDETILSGQHQHQFNLASILLPDEIITSFVVLGTITPTCPCPVTVIYIPTTTTTTTQPTETTIFNVRRVYDGFEFTLEQTMAFLQVYPSIQIGHIYAEGDFSINIPPTCYEVLSINTSGEPPFERLRPDTAFHIDVTSDGIQGCDDYFHFYTIQNNTTGNFYTPIELVNSYGTGGLNVGDVIEVTSFAENINNLPLGIYTITAEFENIDPQQFAAVINGWILQ